MNIGIIGCGHMGSAVANALISQQLGKIHISNPIKPRLDTGGHFTWTPDNASTVRASDIIVLAVRPAVIAPVLEEIRPLLKPAQVLISIAAGIPLKKLQKFSGNHKKIVRVMPNLAAQVCEGISVWQATNGCTKEDKKAISSLLNSFGKSIEAANEELIDIATAVGGGGPAYTAAFLESMSNAAINIGFSEEDARLLAMQSVLGSIKYLQKTGMSFEELKNAVQTKGGTTEAGFKVLKNKKWQRTLEKALLTGYKRARKISKW
ncbi:pyrroline-5-carboxylate reductase [Candidatus Peregrinibacteria bacterium]|nr:pyrroline-5-carboxylate reductase [Candidatus Peregrinibacteria bacterium]